jgi:hypothetical protein
MILFGDSNESAEAFIGDNLSLYQSRWLKIQCEALGESRAQLLEAILREWYWTIQRKLRGDWKEPNSPGGR